MTMKFIVAAVILAVCAAAQAATISKSSAVTLLDYYKSKGDVGRIIGGKPAKKGQLPWQVALTVKFMNGSAFCGGSLISPRWILTVAHCVDGGIEWSAKIGGIYFYSPNEPGSIVVSSNTGIIHENYNSWLNNDIGLVKLHKNVLLSETIQPIRLPTRSEARDSLKNIKASISGWGKTNDTGSISQVLNYVELDTITNKKCAKVYGSDIIISSTICCVGHHKQSPCDGDIGGALFRFDSDGKPTQIGIASFVASVGCASGNPSGYVRTGSYLDWINEKTGIPILP